MSSTETLSKLGPSEKLEAVIASAGFRPTSRRELSHALTLQDPFYASGTREGASILLRGAVFKHKLSGVKDFKAVARRLTHDFAGYANDAQLSRANLETLHDLLAEANPELLVGVTLRPEEIDGLMEFLRYSNLEKFRQTGNSSEIGYSPLDVDYDPDDPVIAASLERGLAEWRVQPVRLNLPQAIDDQINRDHFWVARVQEIDQFYPEMQKITIPALQQLVMVEPVQ